MDVVLLGTADFQVLRDNGWDDWQEFKDGKDREVCFFKHGEWTGVIHHSESTVSVRVSAENREEAVARAATIVRGYLGL